MSENDGGSAFPQIKTGYDDSSHTYDGHVYSTGGMSMRDYFAAKAVQGLLAWGGYEAADQKTHAKWAYQLADAMLEARGE